MAISRAIGIDLGTTHTVVAEANPAGHTIVLRTREGESLIPSVVLLADDRTVVGREAQLRGRAHPDRLAACAKRQLGQPLYDQRIGGEWFPPEVLEACLLQAVKREWLSAPRESRACVIAVPAHFNESQRHAVATAVEMSGLTLLELVNEPIAAALAFAEHTPVFSPTPLSQPPQAVLVYDLGGYTFEATVLWVSSGQLTMAATEHDSHLGGHDWDLRLADFFAEPFIRKYGLDPRSEPAHLDRLIQQAIQAKLALSVRSHTTLQLAYGGHVEKITVTRQQFEGMTADLIERTAKICQASLQRAGVSWSQLGGVLLVGGATRMPMIRHFLTQKSGRAVDDHVCPDEAVARGAAIYAARVLQRQTQPPTLQVTSVSTHSLGIEGSDQHSGQRVNKVLIPKGTPLPATATREFMSKNNSGQSIVFNVLEGESQDPSKCVTIGRVIMRDLPPDISDEWPVEIKYSYSCEGRLNVDARVRYTDRHVRLQTVRPGGVSSAHVARWNAVVTAQAGMAAFRQVRAWERAADAPPPLVLAGNAPRSPVQPETPQEKDEQDLWSFLKRVVPFAFGRTTPAAPPASETPPG